MAAEFLEQLPRLILPGRRMAQRLFDARMGRNRERAVLKECIAPTESSAHADASSASRLLCGDPSLALAALLAEQAAGAAIDIAAAIVDTAPPPQAGAEAATVVQRLAHCVPTLELARRLLGDARPMFVRVPEGESSTMRLVFEAFWTADAVDADPRRWPRALAGDAGVVLFCSSDGDWLARAVSACDGPWIACIADPAQATRFRRALLARGTHGFSREVVGASPVEWARRHVGAGHAVAMHAALWAFGATPLASDAGEGDHAVGIVDDAAGRTLAWVDAPDRVTNEATLCRAIAQAARTTPACDGIAVLAWHVAAALPQALAARRDPPMTLHAIRALPRLDGGLVRLARDAFVLVAPATGPRVARQANAGGTEWLLVEWPRDHDVPRDWSIDPDHADEVFRGAWHAVQEGGGATVRSVRLRLPRRAGPRRVCIRTTDATGRTADIVEIVRLPDTDHAPARRTAHAAPARPAPLC